MDTVLLHYSHKHHILMSASNENKASTQVIKFRGGFDLVMIFISKPCMCPWVDLDCFCIRYLAQMLQVKSCHSFGWITPFYCNHCDCLFHQRLPAPICGMTSSNGRIFRVTGYVCGEFTGDRWIPRIKASDAELWLFLWSTSELAFE